MQPEPDLIVPTLAPDLPGPVRLGLVAAAPVRIAPSDAPFLAEVEATTRALTGEHAGRPPSEIEGLAAARDFYRLFGIDPTRTRPSSEALLRRVLQGTGMPRILNAVDICNLCALRFLLSIGLYDAGAIRGGVTFHPGRAGESYAGIRKDEVHLEGRPVLSDEAGPFGNPTSDSLRTSITAATCSIWMVIFAPASLPVATLERHVASSRALMERFLAPPDGPVATAGRVVASGAQLAQRL